MADTIVLRVIEGPKAGETFELSRREPTIVGRSRTATIRIDSPGLSREHFELWWDGETWRVRDLESRNGLLVNRRPVQEAPLNPGDELQAGDTRYSLEIAASRKRIVDAPSEDRAADSMSGQVRDQTGTMILPLPVYDHVAPTLTPPAPELAPGSLLAELVNVCARQDGERLYALIDGAQSFELAFTARLMGNRLYTLFSGKLAVDLAHVGPCLVELSKPEAFLASWVAAMGAHSGVLFLTSAELTTVYNHLRSIFRATDEAGKEYFFRFYDPRVIRPYLPTCTEGELTEFFGPISAWIAEDGGTRQYCLYQRSNGRLSTALLGSR